MNFEKLNSYVERSFEHVNIKELSLELDNAFLDDNVVKKGMWFLDLGKYHRMVCDKNPYFYNVDMMVNRLMRRKRITLVPFEYKGECRLK